ncbi:MAG: M48 family metallopeptidase [Chitinophagaceae bacterium]|nr:M48 family metallopeptidase [Chitinophagaceae bacterium]
MKTWFGSYYDSRGAEPVEASVLAAEEFISFAWRTPGVETRKLKWDMKDVEAVADNSVQGTVITYNRDNSMRLVIPGKDAADFIGQIKAEKAKPWHKKGRTKEWLRNLSIFFGFAGVLVIAYLLLVPWLSEQLASTVSVKTEQQFGEAVYTGMQLSAQEDTQASALVNEFFQQMHVRTSYDVRISVVRGDVVNAFALPGGRIVVYSALLDQLNSYPELAALLSHEFTHVNNRHSTKSIFRRLGSKVFLGLLFGNTGSVTGVLVSQADDFKSLTYSRKLEKEADLEGLDILKERQIDPAGFKDLFRQLKASSPASALPEMLESHPDIAKRIAYIREASQNIPVKEDTALRTIFEKIKTTTK